MLRSVTWRLYAGIAALLAAQVISGFWLATNAVVEMHLYQTGLAALVLTPLIVAGAYTASGNKWWSNNLGTAFVIALVLYSYLAIPLAWVFLFDNGILTNTWLAWFEVSAPVFICLTLIWLSAIFLRIGRHKLGSGGDLDGPVPPDQHGITGNSGQFESS